MNDACGYMSAHQFNMQSIVCETHFFNVLVKVINPHQIHGILHMTWRRERTCELEVAYGRAHPYDATCLPCFKPNEMKLTFQRSRVIG